MKLTPKIVGTLAAMVIVYLAFFTDDYGEKLEFEGTEVYFTEEVSRSEAAKLGKYLVSSGFADGGRKSVQLAKRDTVYRFRMVVPDDVVEDSTDNYIFQAIGQRLSYRVFENAPVEVETCSSGFKTIRVYK